MKFSHLVFKRAALLSVFLAFFCTSAVSAGHLLIGRNFSGAWYLAIGPADGHNITGSQIMDFDPCGEIIEVLQAGAAILESLFLEA